MAKAIEYRVMLVKERTYEYGGEVVSTPDIVEKLLRLMEIHRDPQESIVVFYLDARRKITGIERVARGAQSSCIIAPKELLRGAILACASAIIVAHNHPSGDVMPSADDLNMTKKLKDVTELVGISLLDSVIIGDGFLSMKEKGML